MAHPKYGWDFVVQSGCWVWRKLAKRGYAIRKRKGRPSQMMHQVSYRLFNGEIPAEREIDHVCRNTRCVNPEHLEAVTHTENVRRGASTRLRPEEIQEMRRLHSNGCGKEALATRFGVTPRHCMEIVRGGYWQEDIRHQWRITKEDATHIHWLYAYGYTRYALAVMFKMSAGHIGKILRGVHWGEVRPRSVRLKLKRKRKRRPRPYRRRRPPKPREEWASVRLTAAQVQEIRKKFRPGRGGGYRRLAKEFGVSHTNIKAIVQRQTWQDVPNPVPP